MAQKKLTFGNTELQNAVLALLDSGQAADFRSAFAIVMHERGIFHGCLNQKATYNVYFRRIRPLVTTALNAQQLPKPKATRQPKMTAPASEDLHRHEFADLFNTGQLGGFTLEP